LRATISGPVRVSQNTSDLGGAPIWQDHRTVQAQLARETGAAVVPRFESTYLTIQGQEIERWSAGLLLGVDPQVDPSMIELGPYMVWGSTMRYPLVYDEEGRSYVPFIIGQAAAERLNVTLDASGRPAFDQPLTITSGHTIGTGLVPLTVEAVVVGTFKTGLEPLDKFTAFIPIQQARILAGYAEEDPVANVFLLFGTDADKADAIAEGRLGLHSSTSDEYALSYMGSMLVVLYGAAALGVVLFLVILLVWTVHQTNQFLRQDQAVLASLRAIGIPPRQLQRSYSGLLVATFGVAGGAAFLLAVLLLPLVPPLGWNLSGLDAMINLPVRPGAFFLVVLTMAATAASTAWLTVRRIGGRSILAMLRGA
jgi:ABC-type lipoprotein release transport system permease subunit